MALLVRTTVAGLPLLAALALIEVHALAVVADELATLAVNLQLVGSSVGVGAGTILSSVALDHGARLVDIAAVAYAVLAGELGIRREIVLRELVPLTVAVIHPLVLRGVVPPVTVALGKAPAGIASEIAGLQVAADASLQRDIGSDGIDASGDAASRAANDSAASVNRSTNNRPTCVDCSAYDGPPSLRGSTNDSSARLGGAADNSATDLGCATGYACGRLACAACNRACALGNGARAFNGGSADAA